MLAYDNDNLFAKILRGEISCYRIFENDRTLAFLDIMPRSVGHTLVIPKAPCRNIFDITPADLTEVAHVARIIAIAARRAFGADGMTLQQLSEEASGQEVFHFHMHVMPRQTGVALLPPASRKEDPAILEDHATRLIAALRT